MYKLLIADDDEIICRGLGTCIPWEENNIEITGLVYDGEMALECVEREKPDIVIVDINMPFMDGIEFSYAVRQNYPEIKIIMLTAYKEFAYAQKAVKLQVFEYLTKPFTNEEVLEAVRRAADALEEERNYRSRIQRNLGMIQEKNLEELTLYGTAEEETIKNSGICSPENYFQAVILYLRRIPGEKEGGKHALIEDEVALRMAADKLRTLISREKDCSLFLQSNRIVLVFEYKDRNAGKKVRERITGIMGEIAKEDTVFLAGGVGRVCHGAERLPSSYQEAVYALEQRYGYGNRSVILYTEVQGKAAEYDVELPAVRKRLQEGVQQRSSEKIRQEVECLFQKLKRTERANLPSVQFLLVELLRFCWEMTEEGELYETFLKQYGQLFSRMIAARNLWELREAADMYFNNLYSYLDAQNTTDIEKRVNQAVEFIKENFPDPDLNLNDVARHVNLSASYLGNSIKKYKKTSYVSLLNQIRIDNAKKLLARPDIKTYEVAFLVGFNSSQYFSSSFKKSTGMTPGAYRESAFAKQNGVG